jgi:hypothetical protein
VQDALHLARVIDGCKLFIGNQSFPLALAMALNVRVIQECCPRTPDCIFRRPTAQYFLNDQRIEWPEIGQVEYRSVVAQPTSAGLIEFCPQANATGLGDLLTLTPLAANLKNGVLCLHPSLDRYATLFTDLCPVKFTSNPPFFRHVGGVNMALSRLKFFGLENVSPLPVVMISDQEKVEAQSILSQFGDKNSIAFCPSCSKTWAHIRERPQEFWEPIVRVLSERFNVIQFGRTDYPLVKGASRAPFVPVRQLASFYAIIGNFFGVDTGDYHLAVATGCYCVVFRPHEQEGYCRSEWEYSSPKITYLEFDLQQALAHYEKAKNEKKPPYD